MDSNEYICVECLLSNIHNGREIVSIEKACRNKVEAYKELMSQAEEVSREAKNWIMRLKENLEEHKLREKSNLKTLEEYFDEVLTAVLEKKNLVTQKFEHENQKFQEKGKFSIDELSQIEELVSSQINYTSMPLHVFTSNIQEKEDNLQRLKTIMLDKPSIPHVSLPDILSAELGDLMNQIKSITAKTCEKEVAKPAQKPSERQVTPSRILPTASKLPSQHQAGLKHHSFHLNILTSHRDSNLTPRIHKDHSKKSLTRSKSPIFRTDIRKFPLTQWLRKGEN